MSGSWHEPDSQPHQILTWIDISTASQGNGDSGEQWLLLITDDREALTKQAMH